LDYWVYNVQVQNGLQGGILWMGPTKIGHNFRKLSFSILNQKLANYAVGHQ
jgi:hypothetical protein